jgi:hypothetical protein
MTSRETLEQVEIELEQALEIMIHYSVPSKYGYDATMKALRTVQRRLAEIFAGDRKGDVEC